MYSQIHIEYANPDNLVDTFILKYKINNSHIAQKWAKKVEECISSNFKIDDPGRFYGFNAYDIEKINAMKAINKCCEIINNYSPIIEKTIDKDIDQDTLNYLHHVFEVYHGLLDTPHDFFKSAPREVQQALAQLNIEVHRCEAFVGNSSRKIMPRHVVTWFEMKREEKLELEDYDQFTDWYKFGTIYIQYVEIGKTLEDLAIDDDQYIFPEAYKPFVYFTADFVVRFFNTGIDTWKQNRSRMRQYYLKNQSFFDERNLPLSHYLNRPGYIPVAEIMPTAHDPIKEIGKRQFVKSVHVY